MGNYMSNQLSYRHTQRVVVKMDMEKGNCGAEFHWARRDCERRKSPAEVQCCIKSTAALQECMKGNECHFKNYIRIMNLGLNEDEQRDVSTARFLYFREEKEERWRWRWWTGMIRTSPPPAS